GDAPPTVAAARYSARRQPARRGVGQVDGVARSAAVAPQAPRRLVAVHPPAAGHPAERLLVPQPGHRAPRGPGPLVQQPVGEPPVAGPHRSASVRGAQDAPMAGRRAERPWWSEPVPGGCPRPVRVVRRPAGGPPGWVVRRPAGGLPGWARYRVAAPCRWPAMESSRLARPSW